MKNLLLALAMVIATIPSTSQAKAVCSIPVQITVNLVDTFGVSGPITSAIQPDSGGPYVNGVSGISATIDGCSGTYDLLLNLGQSKRTITINLADMVGSPTPYTPAWASAGPVPLSFFNIRNLFYHYSQNSTYSFTTRLASNLGGVAKGYNFGMVNPTDQAYTPPPINPEMNDPITTSYVIVWHYAAGSNGYTVETWVAYPDTAQMDPNTTNSFYVGGLTTATHTTTVSAGQFSVPFQITVQRK
jgi:hypothetical protein